MGTQYGRLILNFRKIIIMSLVQRLLILLLLCCHIAMAQTPELVPYRKGDQFGYANEKKEIKIPVQYDFAGLFS